ncbi:MAG: hypothetical protein ACM3NH_03460 [Candidatus Saccharibacteria bacterium]
MKITKLTQILSVVMGFVMLAVPFFAGAQGLRIPSGGSFGLPDQATASDFIIFIINIALAIAGLIAVFFLIIGGFRYITAAGNEDSSEQAKKIILNAIIGIVVIILSFVIVRVISNALTRGSGGV